MTGRVLLRRLVQDVERQTDNASVMSPPGSALAQLRERDYAAR